MKGERRLRPELLAEGLCFRRGQRLDASGTDWQKSDGWRDGRIRLWKSGRMRTVRASLYRMKKQAIKTGDKPDACVMGTGSLAQRGRG